MNKVLAVPYNGLISLGANFSKWPLDLANLSWAVSLVRLWVAKEYYILTYLRANYLTYLTNNSLCIAIQWRHTLNVVFTLLRLQNLAKPYQLLHLLGS